MFKNAFRLVIGYSLLAILVLASILSLPLYFIARLTGQGTMFTALTSAIGYGVRDRYVERFDSSAAGKPQ